MRIVFWVVGGVGFDRYTLRDVGSWWLPFDGLGVLGLCWERTFLLSVDIQVVI